MVKNLKFTQLDKNNLDENGFCGSCSWNSAELNCHFMQTNKCKYLKKNYKFIIKEDENGDGYLLIINKKTKEEFKEYF